jgi:hypothetical protein
MGETDLWDYFCIEVELELIVLLFYAFRCAANIVSDDSLREWRQPRN